jgi:hypothetical protein
VLFGEGKGTSQDCQDNETSTEKVKKRQQGKEFIVKKYTVEEQIF